MSGHKGIVVKEGIFSNMGVRVLHQCLCAQIRNPNPKRVGIRMLGEGPCLLIFLCIFFHKFINDKKIIDLYELVIIF